MIPRVEGQDRNSVNPLPVDPAFDCVVMLDVIEHVKSGSLPRGSSRCDRAPPPTQADRQHGKRRLCSDSALLLAGQFNYGKRGILDMTHTRLFTFSTMRRLLDGSDFQIEETRGIPAPFTVAVGEKLGRALLRANRSLISIRKQLFAYQIFTVASPRPLLPYLLAEAHSQSQVRAGTLVE